MSIKNRRVSMTAVNEFFRLVTLFRQTFLEEFTKRLNEPATPERVETGTLHDAFVSACQRCITQLQTDGAGVNDGSSKNTFGRAA